MDSFQNSYPSQLSGGNNSECHCTRLVPWAKVLMLDEPSSALDPDNTKVLANLLSKLTRDGYSIVVSSQDMAFVNLVRDQIYLMEDGCIAESWDRKERCVNWK